MIELPASLSGIRTLYRNFVASIHRVRAILSKIEQYLLAVGRPRDVEAIQASWRSLSRDTASGWSTELPRLVCKDEKVIQVIYLITVAMEKAAKLSELWMTVGA